MDNKIILDNTIWVNGCDGLGKRTREERKMRRETLYIYICINGMKEGYENILKMGESEPQSEAI